MAKKPVGKLVVKLGLMVLAMFGFGFALVPIYEVFCEVTGLNGKTSKDAYTVVASEIDKSRIINIQLFAMNNDKMNWAFKPNENVIKVNPGESRATAFYAKNPASNVMTAQAVPSISPARAAEYFHKIECFCFNQQVLQAGEEAQMGLKFVVDKNLPEDIQTITLTYTLFDVTDDKVASTK